MKFSHITKILHKCKKYYKLILGDKNGYKRKFCITIIKKYIETHNVKRKTIIAKHEKMLII